MRVFFRPGTTVFPKGGRQDGVTYCYQYNGRLCFARNYYEVPMRAQNFQVISLSKIAQQIWTVLPRRFKNNLKSYTSEFIKKEPSFRCKFISSYAVFMKIIHKINKQFSSFAKEQSPVNFFMALFGHMSLYDFIKSGYLMMVNNARKLNSRILKDNRIIYYRGCDNLLSNTLITDYNHFIILTEKDKNNTGKFP